MAALIMVPPQALEKRLAVAAELADRPDDVQACRPTTWPSPLAAQRTNPHNRQWPLTLIRFALGEMSTPLTIDETSSGQLRALQAQ